MSFVAFIAKNAFARWTLIAIVVLLLVFLVGKALGKNKAFKPIKLPDNGQGIPVGWEPQMFALVTELFKVMDGLFTTSVDKENAWVRLNVLTNDQITAVYNEFNRQFGKKNKGTLTDWIADEKWTAIGSIQNQLVSRMKSIGLD